MNKLLLALVVALAGCASQPMTPEQAAMFMQMQQNQQANNAAYWQNMQSNPLYQRMPMAQPYQPPVYQAPSYQPPAYQPRLNTNCNSFVNGRYITTSCN